MVPRKGLIAPERKSERDKRRAIIASSPTHTEVIDGREWRIVSLPDPGEAWVVEWPYPERNGDDRNGSHPPNGEERPPTGNLPSARFIEPE